MKIEQSEVEINGVKYVKASAVINKLQVNLEGLKMYMIRTYSAGVHFGYLSREESTLAGMEVTLLNARRVWSWAGAASLSQLAMCGTTKPDKCKMPCEVTSIDLVAIEKIPMTVMAVDSLKKVKIWQE
ncbi:MAG: hypothetical protein GY775_16795 [Candidatus Scalindua sp.]|nr:hypothetical protein [Candidatus Scalindua sp.]